MPDEKSRVSQDIWTRAVRAIGQEGMSKLTEAGLVVASKAEFDHFVLAHARESARLREIIRSESANRNVKSARVEVVEVDGKVVAIVTAPACDDAFVAGFLWRALQDKLPGSDVARFDPATVPTPEAAMPPITSKGGSA